MRARACRVASLILLSLVMALGLAPRVAVAHDKLGANLNFIGDFRRNHEFVDVVKQSRLFLRIGTFDDSDPANRAPIGPDGWPTTDFRLLAMAAQQNTLSLAGTYKIVFTGQATLSTGGGGAGTISNQVFDAPSNTTTADLAFPAGGENLMVDFTGTGGAVKNVRIIRPGYPLANTPLLHTPWKSHVQRFPIVRYLDWTRTNGNRAVTWADRTTPEKLRSEAYIAQWETVIDAANSLGRDPWINVPVQANDEYVTNLATLFRDRLDASLNVYVEYGNELWNFNIRDVGMDELNGGAFNGATVNRDLAVASPAGSPLRFDGETDATTLGFRRVALRLKEISDIFRTVWGAAAINTRVRPVLAGQMANAFIVSEGLRLVDEGLGIRPNTVFYALSGAPYIFPSADADGDSDETPGMTAQQILDGLAAGVANAPNVYGYRQHAGLGAWYGLKVVAYEAGFDNFGAGNVASKRLANLDPQIRTICTNLINQWHGFGFEHILWFNAGADTYDTQFGMWPLVEDMANQATPKNQCIDDVLAAALPGVTVGTPATGGPIAGGSYDGSSNPSGSVSGVDPPFGFPGYVEYLLRADVAGSYNLVFTGSVPAGESFRLLLNNAVVLANASWSGATSSPIPVTLRAGLNAMRIERAVGASFSISSFALTLQAPAAVTRLSGISTRGRVLTGNDIMIGGFIIGGSTPKRVIIYARGPSLSAQNVPGVLPDPVLQLVQGGIVIATNDNWQQATNAAEVQAMNLAPANVLESAILATLAPGAYTALVSGLNGGTGVGIVEVYEVDGPHIPLVGISTRGVVQTGDNVMIAGFIVSGTTPQTVVVKARGPSVGVPGALANPTLTLVRAGVVIATNDNWRTRTNSATLEATGGAPPNDLESAILITLDPGAYTAILSGVGEGTGVGIVEVYAQ